MIRFILLMSMMISGIAQAKAGVCENADYEKAFSDPAFENYYCLRATGLLGDKKQQVAFVVARHKEDYTLFLKIQTVDSQPKTIFASQDAIADESLLPLKFKGSSNLKIAVGDINGDGREDWALVANLQPESARLMAMTYDAKAKTFKDLPIFDMKGQKLDDDLVFFNGENTEITAQGCLVVPVSRIVKGGRKIHQKQFSLSKRCHLGAK